MTTEEKEEALKGKEIDYDTQIHMHYTWMKTISSIRENYNSSVSDRYRI